MSHVVGSESTFDRSRCLASRSNRARRAQNRCPERNQAATSPATCVSCAISRACDWAWVGVLEHDGSGSSWRSVGRTYALRRDETFAVEGPDDGPAATRRRFARPGNVAL